MATVKGTTQRKTTWKKLAEADPDAPSFEEVMVIGHAAIRHSVWLTPLNWCPRFAAKAEDLIEAFASNPQNAWDEGTRGQMAMLQAPVDPSTKRRNSLHPAAMGQAPTRRKSTARRPKQNDILYWNVGKPLPPHTVAQQCCQAFKFNVEEGMFDVLDCVANPETVAFGAAFRVNRRGTFVVAVYRAPELMDPEADKVIHNTPALDEAFADIADRPPSPTHTHHSSPNRSHPSSPNRSLPGSPRNQAFSPRNQEWPMSPSLSIQPPSPKNGRFPFGDDEGRPPSPSHFSRPTSPRNSRPNSPRNSQPPSPRQFSQSGSPSRRNQPPSPTHRFLALDQLAPLQPVQPTAKSRWNMLRENLRTIAGLSPRAQRLREIFDQVLNESRGPASPISAASPHRPKASAADRWARIRQSVGERQAANRLTPAAQQLHDVFAKGAATLKEQRRLAQEAQLRMAREEAMAALHSHEDSLQGLSESSTSEKSSLMQPPIFSPTTLGLLVPTAECMPSPYRRRLDFGPSAPIEIRQRSLLDADNFGLAELEPEVKPQAMARSPQHPTEIVSPGGNQQNFGPAGRYRQIAAHPTEPVSMISMPQGTGTATFIRSRSPTNLNINGSRGSAAISPNHIRTASPISAHIPTRRSSPSSVPHIPRSGSPPLQAVRRPKAQPAHIPHSPHGKKPEVGDTLKFVSSRSVRYQSDVYSPSVAHRAVADPSKSTSVYPAPMFSPRSASTPITLNVDVAKLQMRGVGTEIDRLRDGSPHSTRPLLQARRSPSKNIDLAVPVNAYSPRMPGNWGGNDGLSPRTSSSSPPRNLGVDSPAGAGGARDPKNGAAVFSPSGRLSPALYQRHPSPRGNYNLAVPMNAYSPRMPSNWGNDGPSPRTSTSPPLRSVGVDSPARTGGARDPKNGADTYQHTVTSITSLRMSPKPEHQFTSPPKGNDFTVPVSAYNSRSLSPWGGRRSRSPEPGAAPLPRSLADTNAGVRKVVHQSSKPQTTTSYQPVAYTTASGRGVATQGKLLMPGSILRSQGVSDHPTVLSDTSSVRWTSGGRSLPEFYSEPSEVSIDRVFSV